MPPVNNHVVVQDKVWPFVDEDILTRFCTESDVEQQQERSGVTGSSAGEQFTSTSKEWSHRTTEAKTPSRESSLHREESCDSYINWGVRRIGGVEAARWIISSNPLHPLTAKQCVALQGNSRHSILNQGLEHPFYSPSTTPQAQVTQGCGSASSSGDLESCISYKVSGSRIMV